MSLSSNMSTILRKKMREAVEGTTEDIELETIKPILDIQNDWSILPNQDQFLIEKTIRGKAVTYFSSLLKVDMYMKVCLH